ncbi:MAG: ATP-binding cassette domain-containing protein [Oscillospiraceae bacterium]|nr:ATP-binding cassette domain-containing protein [Oscillospiraceae bacterium]
MEMLAAKNLSVTFPECNTPVLSDISFSVEAGAFAILCGATGCGKSTLLRMCKRELMPLCEKSGTVTLEGMDIAEAQTGITAADIGFVMQHPEQQIVTDRVWHELAFGLENLGYPTEVIRRRIAEMAAYFGMEEWLECNPAELSGGQKQLLNLAGVMIMQPKLLLLDEPTSQLDPIAAADFLNTLQRLNRDFSVTILLAEHRLEEVIPMCSHLMIMQNGRIERQGSPRSILQTAADGDMPDDMPAAVRLYHGLHMQGNCPLSVREARQQIMPLLSFSRSTVPEKDTRLPNDTALAFSDVYFRYGRREKDVLRHLTFQVVQGEIYGMIGGNGAGKSTALSVAAGLHRAYAGRVSVFGKKISAYTSGSLYRDCIAMLPQDVQTLFLYNTAEEELSELDAEYRETLKDYHFDMDDMLSQHPYDLSGGQQQMLALAKVLLMKPRLLLLDEPTKGLDAASRQGLGEMLLALQKQGITILLVTHDIEFAAQYANRIGFLSQGEMISEDTPREFFSGNAFYTTAASRISRGWLENAVTIQDILQCLPNERCDQ